MNKLEGKITDIKVSGGLSVVTVELTGGIALRSIIIETPDSASYLKNGNPINVVFKETEVILAKGETSHLSLQNRIKGKVHSISNGELLTEVMIECEPGRITAIVSKDAFETMNVRIDDMITALIKQNEVMLAE